MSFFFFPLLTPFPFFPLRVYGHRYIIDSIKKEAPGLEIVYRPHPLINGPKVFCRLEDIEGVTLQFSSDISLDDALDQAAFVVAISSTALVQVGGIPRLFFHTHTYIFAEVPIVYLVLD